MSKIWKKGLSLLLVGTMVFGMTACGDSSGQSSENTSDSVAESTGESDSAEQPSEEVPASEEASHSTDPLEMITDGYYTYGYTAEGHGDYNSFFHFYEEVPVLGAVFYVGYLNNQSNFAGTYTVEKADFAWEKVGKDRAEIESAGQGSGTAPYTISFYDFSGNLIDQCGYDGEIIYNDMDVITGYGAGGAMYYHDTDGEASKYADTYAGEIGVAYLDFVAAEDEIATLTLNHNMTYVDMVGTMIEGTWEMAENAEGGYDYTLTPNEASDTGAVLSISADGQTGTYTPEGGASMEMVNRAASGPAVAGVYGGTVHVDSYGIDVDLTMNLYDDGSCELLGNVGGREAVLDEGTYALDASYTMNFTMEKGGEFASIYGEEGMTIPYKGTTDIGDLDVVLTGVESEPEVLFSFTGGYCTLDCYADNTYKFAFESYELEETGTWAFENYSFSITQDNGNVITAEMDADTHAFTLNYVAVANESLTDVFTCGSDVWGPALMQQGE